MLLTIMIHRVLPHLVAFMVGIASWYGTGAGAHGCAMTALPRGSVVYIQNLKNHRWSWCKVNDYGPAAPRVIDVSPRIAKELHFLSAGLASVRLYVETHQ